LVGRSISLGLSPRKAAVSDATLTAGTKASFRAPPGKLFVPATPSLWKKTKQEEDALTGQYQSLLRFPSSILFSTATRVPPTRTSKIIPQISPGGHPGRGSATPTGVALRGKLSPPKIFLLLTFLFRNLNSYPLRMTPKLRRIHALNCCYAIRKLSGMRYHKRILEHVRSFL